MTLDHQTGQLNDVNRALYGDSKNSVKGLLKDVEDIKDWISTQKKRIAWLTGAALVIGFVLTKGWDLLLYIFGKK